MPYLLSAKEKRNELAWWSGRASWSVRGARTASSEQPIAKETDGSSCSALELKLRLKVTSREFLDFSSAHSRTSTVTILAARRERPSRKERAESPGLHCSAAALAINELSLHQRLVHVRPQLVVNSAS